MPFFSIITPVYNCSQFLEVTIKSVINQTLNDWELIIIDDGSSDNSLTIAKQWAIVDPRIRTLHHEGNINRGVSATRNLGIMNSNADWIAFLDADDLWHANKLAESYKLICDNSKIDFIYHKMYLIDENDNNIHSNNSRFYKNHIYGVGIRGLTLTPFLQFLTKGVDIPTSSVLVKKPTLLKTTLFNENISMTEDTQLWLEVFQYGNCYFNDNILGSYRISSIQWNSRVNHDIKATRRFLLYKNLLHTCMPKYSKQITYEIINTGIRNIIKHNIINKPLSNPLNDQNITEYLNNKICIKYKLLFLLVLIEEIIFTPYYYIRYVKKKYKNQIS